MRDYDDAVGVAMRRLGQLAPGVQIHLDRTDTIAAGGVRGEMYSVTIMSAAGPQSFVGMTLDEAIQRAVDDYPRRLAKRCPTCGRAR